MKLVLEDSEKLKLNEKLKGNVVILSVFGESDKFINAKDLKIGCEEILIRRMQGLVLWREYLPDLKLEVVRDGAFDSIQLISGKDHEQDIRQGAGYALDEEIEIKVVNGIISLPASPNNPCYNLPLERKIYGTDEPDKMAQFIVDKPLLEDKQVELWVYYKYGDAESYKLVAKIPGSDETIASKWEDIDSLKNDPPRYQYKNLNDKDVREKDREWISTQFNIFAKKITLQQRPRQEVIYPDGNGNHFLSNYINVGKWPYFQIQNCFRQDEYGVSSRQLVEMNKAGILKCIWHTLDGSLPVGHNLGTVQPVAGGDPVREGKIIKEHISEVTRQMGVLFTLTKDDDPELPETIMGILNYYKTEGNKIENWAPITVYVKRDNDPYGIWNSFSSSLLKLKKQNANLL